MAELRPGYVLTASRGGLRVRPYWQLQAQPHTDDLPTTIGTVRALLEDIVGRHLVADVPLCALLSGGLDSSLVAALAQRHLRARQGRSLQTFSIDFIGSVDHFKSQDMYPDRDAPFAKEVSQHIGSQHHEIILSSADLADDAPRDAVLAARDLPNFLWRHGLVAVSAISRHSLAGHGGAVGRVRRRGVWRLLLVSYPGAA